MRKKTKDEIELLILDLLNDGYVGDKVEKMIYKIIGEKGIHCEVIDWAMGKTIPRITHEDRIKKLEKITKANEYTEETRLVKKGKLKV